MTRLKSAIVVIFLASQVVCYEKLLVDRLRLDFLVLEDKLWEYVLSGRKEELRNDHFGLDTDTGVYLVHRFDRFDKEMTNLTADKEFLMDPFYGMQVVRKTDLFLYVFSDMRIITDLYSKFKRYLSENAKTETGRVSEIVRDVLHSEEMNINKTIADIYKKVFEDKPQSVIYELFELSLKKNACKSQFQSPQQIFYNLYNAISLIELKGYVMTQFAYMAQRLQDKGNNTLLALATREQYRQRIKNVTETFKGTMQILKSEGGIRRCEPESHIEGTTFVQLTRLVQGHIQNEVDLNERRSCTSTCADYSYASNYGCYDSDSEYCKTMKPCNGKILDCKFVRSHFKACISPQWSSRRYEFVEYDNGKVFGEKSWCSFKSASSWHRWFVHCSYCFCLCDAQGAKSDRYFNLRPSLSDTPNNMVVTGLRLIKHNRIVHLQIQEGKLGPYGFIDRSTMRWVPPEDYKVTDPQVKSGEDYHTMTYSNRTLVLDNLYSHETDHVVTGVGFVYADDHLRFQINVRAFDFQTGLLSNDSYYIYGTGRRSQVKIVAPNIPTLTYESQVMDDHNYVEFTHSDIVLDAAQTTIPFMDSQPVFADPPVPLSGAGIYYKGKTGYGGFVAPKVSTYDFSNHLNLNFPDAKERNDNFEEFVVPLN